MAKQLTVAFIGNPNCGKTTLFNAYTGANLKVANWPGVTVERVEGTLKDHDLNIRLVDLPGTYSLTSYTMEEQVSREFILSDEVDVIIDVVDASALERNLYLTLQLLELGKPVVVALNMMDIVTKRGMELDLHRLPEMLGVPVIPVSARKRTGLEVLMHAAAHHADHATHDPIIHEHAWHGSEASAASADLVKHGQYAMVYDELLEFRIDGIQAALQRKWPNLPNPRWHAIKLLEGDAAIKEKCPVELPDLLDKSYETEIINQKFEFIEEIMEEVLVHRAEKAALTEKADRVLLHPVWGLPIFLGIMALVFFLTFTVGDFLAGYFEQGIEWFSGFVGDTLIGWGVGELLVALITDGIIAGVGSILTLLPNIFILFLALAFLEDTGYMARVAYIMDRIMGRLGLSGRAFLPMVLGFGCSVPAIMASRALESRRDRFKVMLVTPFMSCSARLPIYILFSQLFFGRYAMAAAYSMYLIGILVALLVALVIHTMEKNKGIEKNDLLIELPEYKMPSARTVAVYVWEKVKDYLTKAGTIIFAASILLWFLLNFGPGGYTTQMENSFAAAIGHALAPVMAPAGLGFWPIVVAIIAGISAKEVVVSSTAILFRVANVNSAAGMAAVHAGLAAMGFGPLNAYCMMVFCLLYIPCAATIGVIKRESGSWKWTAFSVCFQVAVAYLMSFLIYQLGGLFL
ncbi:MAG: ferrous iron transport protein B [Oscillospiraceae bacterium]|nr:ferrous iron transport protein B [Oscillospiraceae bacterium]